MKMEKFLIPALILIIVSGYFRVYIPKKNINKERTKNIQRILSNLRLSILNGDITNQTELVYAFVVQESSGNPKALGKKGERGLLQIMPNALIDANTLLYPNGFTFDELFSQLPDETAQLSTGIAYMKWIENYYKRERIEINISNLAKGYNGGIGNVKRNTVSTKAKLYAVTIQGYYLAMKGKT